MGAPRAESLDSLPVVYDRHAVLTTEQVALALEVCVRSVVRADLPTFYVGSMPRYLWGKVLDTIAERSQ
jgi:hypothetical protein